MKDEKFINFTEIEKLFVSEGIRLAALACTAPEFNLTDKQKEFVLDLELSIRKKIDMIEYSGSIQATIDNMKDLHLAITVPKRNLKTMRYFRYTQRFGRKITSQVLFKKEYHDYTFDPNNTIILATGYSWIFYRKSGRGRNAEFFCTQDDDMQQYEMSNDETYLKRILSKQYFDETAKVNWDFDDIESHIAQRNWNTGELEIIS